MKEISWLVLVFSLINFPNSRRIIILSFPQFVKYTKPSQPIIQKMDMMFGHMEKYNKLTTVAPDKSNSLPFP